MASTLPIIDFGPFIDPDATWQERRNVAAALDKACREVGFFYLKNHGVPSELMNGILDGARTFFETASRDDKKKIALKRLEEGGDNARGWLEIRSEKGGSHEAVDMYRPVDLGEPPYTTGQGPNQWPQSPTSFRPTAEDYIERVTNLGIQVMKALAMGLDVDEEIFLSRNSLQVLDKTGEWTWVDPIEGCYVCNIGDMLAEWTRGAYKSTLHRVCHNNDSLRVSIPFFFDPNWDAYISPVLKASGAEEEDKYKGIRYADKFVRSIDVPLWRDPLVSTAEHQMSSTEQVAGGIPVEA
ncbi:putative Oxoglutarate 3-dioxygenase [Seiridium cardinale]|uniref:Oxoglutarate 3-dioxygenase n=1 Tax=Seiridium cardinale TaxID=138064 RepID=A0ABR2Y3X6_9PEZI